MLKRNLRLAYKAWEQASLDASNGDGSWDWANVEHARLVEAYAQYEKAKLYV